VRFVCPTYEKDRAEFARSAGLTIAESWWSWDCQTLQGAKRAFESSCLGRRRSRCCPAIVVTRSRGDDALSETGFRRHCDYYTEAINSI